MLFLQGTNLVYFLLEYHFLPINTKVTILLKYLSSKKQVTQEIIPSLLLPPFPPSQPGILLTKTFVLLFVNRMMHFSDSIYNKLLLLATDSVIYHPNVTCEEYATLYSWSFRFK